MVELFANSGDPDLSSRSVVSGLGLHCLPFTRLGVSGHQWVKLDIEFHQNHIWTLNFLKNNIDIEFNQKVYAHFF